MAVAKSDLRPLSTAQLSIWVAQMLDPQSPIYNVGEYLEILGPVDPDLFATALRQVVAESDALHLRVVDTADGPRQVLGKEPDWRLSILDVSEQVDPRAAAEKWMAEDVDRIVDLARGPLFGYALFRLAPDRFLWYARYHHLCNDGFGGWLIPRRVAAVYSALVAGTEVPPSPHGSWVDLLAAEEHYRVCEQYRSDREFWRRRLENLPPPVTLSGKPPAQPAGLRRHRGWIPRRLVVALNELGAPCRARLAHFVIAATAVYMHRFTGEGDLLLGMPVTARAEPALRRTVGMFSNVLPLRLAVNPRDGFGDLLRQVKLRIRELLEHQRYRAEDLRADLGLQPSAPEVFGTTVNVMPFGYDFLFAGHPVRGHNVGNWRESDLQIAVYDRRDGADVCIDLLGNPAHYSSEELAAHRERFVALLAQVAEKPLERSLHRLDLLAPGERRRLLEEFNATRREVPEATLPQLFEAQVKRTPEVIALVSGEQSLSYGELNARANRLAHHLIGLGVGPESFVGVALPRGVEMVVAFLATLKAGAAYLPLDPDYPEARLAHMAADAGPAWVVTSDDLRGRLAPSPVLAVDAPEVCSALSRAPAHDPSDGERTSPLLPHHPSYAIYTSGSTGTPKGVTLPQATLVNLMTWHRPSAAAGRVAQFTSISFDVSLQEILHALLSGGTLVVVDRDTRLEPERLAAFLQQRTVTDLFVPNVVLEHLARAALESGIELPALRNVYQAGEALTVTDRLRAFFARHAGCRLHNHYGPAEAHVVTAEALPPAVEGWPYHPAIGSPIQNLRIYVLDAALEPLPVAVTGELYIAGAGLARGYLGRPGRTAERFVADPRASGTDPGTDGGRMYRTGDLARWRADGNLGFLGRADHQVKIRGFRIEPGEIEAALCRHREVEDALVTGVEQGDEKQLVGYVIPRRDREPELRRRLKGHLRRTLPDYMVPSVLLVLPSWPLTPSGKVDRRALPAPDPRHRLSEQYVMPRNETTRTLARLWQEVLDVERVGEEDDFFALGGHSLMATQVINRTCQLFDIELTVRALFDAPRLADLGAVVSAAVAKSEPGAEAKRPAEEEREEMYL